METSVIVAIISAAAVLVTSALTFFLTKAKERDAEWRKLKLEKYEELLTATSELAANKQSGQRFAKAANDVSLVASPQVLVALRAFLEPIITPAHSTLTNDRHDDLFTSLIYAIREDLGIKPSRAHPDFRLKLWKGGQSST
jgi:hypothetical protein